MRRRGLAQIEPNAAFRIRPRRSSGTAVFTVLLGLLAIGQGVVAKAEEFHQQAMRFDIPEQPLATALDRYSATTGLIGLYSGQLAVGRISRTVVGRFTPSMALAMLLQGSGLAAKYSAVDAFVVVPALRAEPPTRSIGAVARAALAMQDATQRDYSALMQDQINTALCAGALTRPGDYRLVLTFRIGAAAAIEQARIVGSSGDPLRDAAILHALRGQAIGRLAPAHMQQPFTFIVLPESSGGTVDCHMQGASRDG